MYHLCIGNGHLRKKVLEAGNGPDSKPRKGQNVKIFLKMSLSDGTVVEEEPCLSFTLGDGDVIQVRSISYNVDGIFETGTLWYLHVMFVH